jgi:hypothetical protein
MKLRSVLLKIKIPISKITKVKHSEYIIEPTKNSPLPKNASLKVSTICESGFNKI